MKVSELNELMLKVNRICFGDKFRKAFTERFGLCPSGLTYHINERNGILEFILTIKQYGYEHSFNNGVSEFTDAYDYNIGNTSLITEEMSKFVEGYFSYNEIDFYSKYMSDAEIF